MYKQLWDTLISQINELGPPCRSKEEWRQIWFDYKSKHLKKSKSKLSTMITAENPIGNIDTFISIRAGIFEFECIVTISAQQTSSSTAAVVEKGKRSSRCKKLKSEDTVDMIHIEDPKGITSYLFD